MSGNRIWAGGSGLNVIVVVNQNSANSVQLGNDYCELRGVPPQNLLRMTTWAGGSINWSPADFQTNLLDPLLAMVAARGLTNQANFVLLSMDIPYRVMDGDNQNSTTSALFYGFKTNTAPVAGIDSCSLPDASSNSYAYSELSIRQATPNTAVTNSFLAMMLTDTNLAGAERILRHSVLADNTWPTQNVYLAKTTDPARNVRFVEFDNSVFENQVIGNYAVSRMDTNSTLFTNLFGLLTGLGGLPLYPDAFVPGAVGDSLTSFGGQILENSGQTPSLAFLEAGAAGSYGTVVEPCNYTQKFPDAVDYFYQARGFSLAEAYYQSVLNPFEGLFIGEPLVAPFARPGSADWSSLTNGAVLTGTTLLNLNFSAAATNLPLAQADLFVDGTFFKTMTNLPPVAGNVLSVVLKGTTINYSVPANATLATNAAGLAEALNAQTGLTHVKALPAGDRVELQSLDVFVPGSNVTVSAGATIGLATGLTTRLTAARPAFLDTVAKGYEVMTVYNAPITGDWLQVTFVKTNGMMISLGVTNTVSGSTVGTMAQNLVNLINASPALQAADGVSAADFFDYDPYGQAATQFTVYARTPGWPAAQILTTLNTSTNLPATPAGTNPLEDNVADLRPRNHLYAASGTNVLAVNFACDTAQLPDGYHQFTAVAYEGTSVGTQTRIEREVRIQNTSLSATLAALPTGSNAMLGQQLQFTIAANTTNIARIELFTTGGSVGVATNQAVGVFAVSAAYLGLGLHPFYALVTDQAGHRYQTGTAWYQIIPNITLTLSGTPPVLAWPTVPGSQYYLQSTTNLASGFQTVATITATNPVVSWSITTTGNACFYRVQLAP
ncbi:MAG: TIGR03790 family protein [Verrucomicrobiae bacterium]|nr:TIGR03790 family protein [Verrucomicrobiae bacterium]